MLVTAVGEHSKKGMILKLFTLREEKSASPFYSACHKQTSCGALILRIESGGEGGFPCILDTLVISLHFSVL